MDTVVISWQYLRLLMRLVLLVLLEIYVAATARVDVIAARVASVVRTVADGPGTPAVAVAPRT